MMLAVDSLAALAGLIPLAPETGAPSAPFTHDRLLAALSMAAAVAGCYAALELGARAQARQGLVGGLWLAAAGLMLGAGVWAMHFIALVALAGMYWVTPLKDRVRLTAIALICAGAIGNLLDRIRNPAGVVDFLDVGINELRWPVFNVADIAVTAGAVFLALSLWREERHPDEKE